MPHSTTYAANANAILPSFVETALALAMLAYPGTCNWSVRGGLRFPLVHSSKWRGNAITDVTTEPPLLFYNNTRFVRESNDDFAHSLYGRRPIQAASVALSQIRHSRRNYGTSAHVQADRIRGLVLLPGQ